MSFSSPRFSVITIILLFPTVMLGRHIAPRHTTGHGKHVHGPEQQAVMELQKEPYDKKIMRMLQRRPSTLMVAGSSLPNCSHACGSCSPCRLVMVSFICEEEAETCPMAYKCKCNSKSYPVP